jgi:hypothetical protein
VILIDSGDGLKVLGVRADRYAAEAEAARYCAFNRSHGRRPMSAAAIVDVFDARRETEVAS